MRFLDRRLKRTGPRLDWPGPANPCSKDLSSQFRYYRFNVQNGMDDIGLEEWQNWDLMISLTRNYLDSVDVPASLTECARDLLHPPGFESM
jgi:hypothetical protein